MHSIRRNESSHAVSTRRDTLYASPHALGISISLAAFLAPVAWMSRVVQWIAFEVASQSLSVRTMNDTSLVVQWCCEEWLLGNFHKK
jgi:hypothetical protein